VSVHLRAGTARERGISIRWYLTALVLVPLIGLLGFAAYEAHDQLGRAAQARRVEEVIHRAEQFAQARADLQQEVLPALARSFVKNPRLFSGVPQLTKNLTELGLAGDVAKLRAATDVTLARLAADSPTGREARRVQVLLRTARHEVDDPALLEAGFASMADTLSALDSAEAAEINRAHTLGVDHTTTQRLADVQLVAELARMQDVEMPDVAAIQFSVRSKIPHLWRTLVTDWGHAVSAATAVRQSASPDVAAAVAQASRPSADSLVDLDEAIANYATYRTPLPLTEVALLYSASQSRSAAMYGVLLQATAKVGASARAQRAAADRGAVAIAAIVAVILLLCGAGAIAVRRAIAKPIEELADEATMVSEGTLTDVSIDGPAEVRTAARGLAAAVENLRKIEAQAAAVAAGDLSSDIVREPLPGPLGAVMHRSVSAVIDAIHERDAAQSDLAHRAAHDALTELPNRTSAMEYLGRALSRAQRSGVMTGLMFIDLDYFKHVNDNFGHSAGDAVLQACAERMRAAVRAGDTVFRLGGDEFVMVMENVDSELDAVHLAERIIETISAPIAIDENVATVGASIGLAFSQDGGVDAERLLSDADAAAYRAKQSGRGRVGIFDDELRTTLTERAELEAALAAALRQNELVLHYQPIVRLDSGEAVGVEALMRWNRPGHGLLPPAAFIPIAEASALINDLERWALREATAQLARWDVEGRTDSRFTVAVNISGRHLMSSHLVADVHQALTDSGVAANRLTLELTETVLVDDVVATRNLTRLREMGVTIAIDDFGTGYTSIGQLPKLPIDKLKIDRSFVASDDPTRRELIQLIVAAAHAFGLTVVAEGIEDVAQATSLEQLGVDTGQGFLFARPQPAGTAGLFGDRARTPAPSAS
jgi:diguanylate cyclase (GGDEF)-like protein